MMVLITEHWTINSLCKVIALSSIIPALNANARDICINKVSLLMLKCQSIFTCFWGINGHTELLDARIRNKGSHTFNNSWVKLACGVFNAVSSSTRTGTSEGTWCVERASKLFHLLGWKLLGSIELLHSFGFEMTIIPLHKSWSIVLILPFGIKQRFERGTTLWVDCGEVSSNHKWYVSSKCRKEIAASVNHKKSI